MGEGQGQEPSYRAFMSYSHRDDTMARWLHRQLETYRLPRHLIGSETPRGLVTPRLTPIFRDLDELSAADDLSAEIKAALARSEVLIILASPAARASKWVNLEIQTFRALHGNSRPVLVALLEGEPADAFPPALTAGGTEPVAADFRREASGGKRLALLKLVAGISGAPLDSLVQRDAQRQLRRVTAITGGALAAVLIMALLLFVALRAQADAERQRQEAEGLVDYMLTDLREQLKGVGRLEVMTGVNERAMKYYGGDTTKALLLKARTLHALGEDDEKRGNLTDAIRKFNEAYTITSTLLLNRPDETNVILAHSQSEYWLGYVDYIRQNFNKSNIRFVKYLNLSNKLLGRDPNNQKLKKEIGYAQGNICAINLEGNLDLTTARTYCVKSLNTFRALNRKFPSDDIIKMELANQNGWISTYYYKVNIFDKSLYHRNEQISLILELIKIKPKDVNLFYRLSLAYRSASEIYFKLNDNKKGRFFQSKSKIGLEKVLKIEPNNAEYATALANIK